MKDRQIREVLEQSLQDAAQADPALNSEALDDDALARVSGAGNPFESIPRPDPQPIDPDVRENG